MRIDSSAGTQEAALDDSDAGEGLAVFFSQNGDATARYRFQIRAITDAGVYDVGEFYSSPPNVTTIPGKLSRMIGGAVVPGATGWRVSVTPMPLANGSVPSDETADIVLTSSKCFTQLGVQRVSERYEYISGTGNGNVLVAPGRRVTGIAAVGLAGGGSLTIGGGSVVTVAAGIGVGLEPGANIQINAQIAFTNVDWVVEYLESA